MAQKTARQTFLMITLGEASPARTSKLINMNKLEFDFEILSSLPGERAAVGCTININ